MRHVTSWLFYFAIVTSLLATLAVAGLWVRSYDKNEVFAHEYNSVAHWLFSARGFLYYVHGQFSATFGKGVWYHRIITWPVQARWHWSIHHGPRASVMSIDISCPHWAILLPLLLVDAWLLRRVVVRWRRRPRAGCCPKCGYDLTGNVSGICSECGFRIEGCRNLRSQ